MLLGCGSSALTGTLTLTVQGDVAPEELAAGIGVAWDDEVNWTREILCTSGGDLGSPTYNVTAYDRSIGDGLEFALAVLAYDGPGTYERDEFQPEPAVTVEFTPGADDRDDEGDDDDSADGDDDDSADVEEEEIPEDDPDDEVDEEEERLPAWHWGTDSGGVCEITIDDDGTSGSFLCIEVPGFLDRERAGEVSLFGDWTCSDLRGQDDDGDNWERGDDDSLAERLSDRF